MKDIFHEVQVRTLKRRLSDEVGVTERVQSSRIMALENGTSPAQSAASAAASSAVSGMNTPMSSPHQVTPPPARALSAYNR
eukprot:6384239-Amphidinium_carterae.1